MWNNFSFKTKAGVIVGIILLICLTFIYVMNFTGRSVSRFTGGLVEHKVNLPNCAEFIGVIFQKDGNSTIKVVTCRGFDGYYYTEEFRDMSPLEGRIKWIPPEDSQGASWMQKRTLSRWLGTEVKVKLPKDFYAFAGPVSTVPKGSGNVKNVTYWTKEGNLKTKEYVDWSIFEGVIQWELSKGSKLIKKEHNELSE
ncbi:MAG: hypothetical protein HQK84_03125 [Nitrospinae bacterium]|nr:hypothetical protein [Nitrospinota bacterium]